MKEINKILSLEIIKPKVRYPDFLNIQISSFKKFISYDNKKNTQKHDGLTKLFNEFFPIKRYKSFNIWFKGYYLSKPLHSPIYCLEEGLTYSVKLYGKFGLFYKVREREEKTSKKDSRLKRIKENIFLCYLPYMTPNGTFIVNGYERIIVSQLIKASGLFFGELSIKNGEKSYYGKIIPEKGIILEFTSDYRNLLYVILDGRNKFYLTIFLRAIGYSYDLDLLNLFKLSREVSLRKTQRRDILGQELAGNVLSFWFEDFIDGITGEIVTLEKNTILLDRNIKISKSIFKKLRYNNIKNIFIKRDEDYNSEYSILYDTLKRDVTNSQQEALIYISNNIKDNITNDKRYAERLMIIKKIVLSKRCRIQLNKILRYPKNILTLTYEDILAIIENLIALANAKKEIEELEHLSKKSVNTIEEQLKEQFTLGLAKILADLKEKIRKKKIRIKTLRKYCKPPKFIEEKSFNKILKSYFTTNPLSQIMDQMNPLSELTQKRRLSYLGTGGLARERAGYEMRDINYSYYGKLCPIETPEGPNIGLISSLGVLAEVNNLDRLINPYLIIHNGKITKGLVYLSSEDEIGKNICQLSKKKIFYASKKQICRINSDYQIIANKKIEFMEVAYNQMASLSVSLIPFLEHNDANRALMGSNMMRQAVPLLKPDLPIVYTGMEKDMIKSTRDIIYSKTKGIVKSVTSHQILIENKNNKAFQKTLTLYKMPTWQKTNNNTCITLNPIVKLGEKIIKGQVLSEGFATKKGELALGKNIRVAFMPFKGYNFEDAMVVSDQLRKQDDFTSINIIKLTIESHKYKLNKDKFTKKIPNLSKKEIKHLDKKGIVKIGTFLNPGKIIVGKISQVSEREIIPEKNLLRTILGDNKLNLKDISVRAGPSIKGIVIRRSLSRRPKIYPKLKFLITNITYLIEYLMILINRREKRIKPNQKRDKPIETKILKTIFKKEKTKLYNLYYSIQERPINQFPTGIDQLITIYIAEKRNLRVGDKMSGRHGNKGVVSKIVKEEDMPFLSDGTIIDMVLNPLGVPSRMNLGQIYETITGDIGYNLKRRFKTPIFNGGTLKDLFKYGKQAKMAPLGKTYLYNGESGEKFKEKTTVGLLYMVKLGHMVDDKMHARSIGPYSLVTQQPLGGKAQYGGQRFGEMEVWALEAFGASNILQELLTIKSDDIKGRIKTYNSIVKGLKLPNPSMPESLRVLINDLKGLCLNIK